MQRSTEPKDLTGMRIEHKVYASAGEKFSRFAFANQIGKVIPMKFSGKTRYQCKVICAVVADDGAFVTLEVEIQ